MIICGIDPGKQGHCVVLYSQQDIAYKFKLIFDKTGLLDKRSLTEFLNSHNIDMILLEQVRGRGGWGATQIFNFGSSFGQIWLTVADYRHKLVPPQTWQKIAHEGVIPKLSTKEKSLISYKRLFPHDPIPRNRNGKIDENIVDALLITTYGMIKYSKESFRRWYF